MPKLYHASARAFFYAGAHSLLVSHWYVDSKAAVKLTTGAFGRRGGRHGYVRATGAEAPDAVIIRPSGQVIAVALARNANPAPTIGDAPRQRLRQVLLGVHAVVDILLPESARVHRSILERDDHVKRGDVHLTMRPEKCGVFMVSTRSGRAPQHQLREGERGH